MFDDRPTVYTMKTLELFLKDRAKASGSMDFNATTEDGRRIFACTGTSKKNSIEFTCNNEDIGSIALAGMISGITHQHVALTHGNIDDTLSDESFTTHDARGFSEWFEKITKNLILIPDTNVIINRSISSLRFTLLNGFPTNISIKIPRLVLLEIERSANNAKSCGKKNGRNIIISSAAELDYLRDIGARYLPELNEQTFEAFSRIAKDQKSDSWIRREIHHEIKDQSRKAPIETPRVTLITSDLINALVANSEGIDSIFISVVDYDLRSTRSARTEQLTLFTIMNAIMFNKIRVKFNDSNRLLIEGNWEGKTSLDWRNDSIRMVQY